MSDILPNNGYLTMFSKDIMGEKSSEHGSADSIDFLM